METSRARTLGAVLALAAAMAWVYGGILVSLGRQWANDDNYSHGFFVIPLAAFFAWERRDALRRAERHPSAVGLLIIGGSLLLLVAGRLGAELFLTRVSLVGVLAGTTLFLLGREHLRVLAFPLAFL